MLHLLGGSVFLALGAARETAAPLPDPYARRDGPAVGPAPVPVVEQVFWVELALEPAVPMRVRVPQGIHYLDRTKPGPNRSRSRFYFRAERSAPAAEIHFD